MASESTRRVRAVRPVALAGLLALASIGAPAAEGARTYIYQCELNGKKLTSDRPIPECINKDQRQLNPDGSLKAIITPTLTDDERADRERLEREAEVARVAKNDAVRRDRNLMQRFPNEAEHSKARTKALDDLRAAAKNSEARIALLMIDRKVMENEKQFYVNEHVNKPLPTLLKQRLDANDAALGAQKSLAQNLDDEVARINKLYDVELLRLRKLWAGAQPGSLGPVPGPQAHVAPAAPSPTAMKTSSQ